ncbi:hypothetical protein [Microcystis sp. LE18-22.4A]|uniref:hypothetical protein n=1 Tax=Microcystis sp. LE18-22.4A TaxID=3016432 RepID=UPI0025899174|nr:hypothetical protein [Microcystis sp. LE18-22.4A]
MRVTQFKTRRSLQASDQMADKRRRTRSTGMALVEQDIIKFRQLEVGTVGQVRSNLGSRQDNFQAIKDNYYKITLHLFYHFWKMLSL